MLDWSALSSRIHSAVQDCAEVGSASLSSVPTRRDTARICSRRRLAHVPGLAQSSTVGAREVDGAAVP